MKHRREREYYTLDTCKYSIHGLFQVRKVSSVFAIRSSPSLASERSERDTLRSVQLRIADIYYVLYIIYSTCKFCSYNP